MIQLTDIKSVVIMLLNFFLGGVLYTYEVLK